MTHRWSGWPGAWCLDCGCEDPLEIALADGILTDDEGIITDEAMAQYREHPGMQPCTEPNSNRHNPYHK